MTIPKIPTVKQLKKRRLNIVVGVPMERTIRDMPFLHFWHIASHGFPIMPFVYGRTDLNRNKMAWATKLNKEFTHICMLDADHNHPHDIVQRLARWVLQDKSRLVVGGLNFRRTTPYDPCIFEVGSNGRMLRPLSWEKGLVKVSAIGHGAILISREVFERLEPPWWAYPYNFAHQNEYPSEDMYFSQYCRQNGIDLWCDTTTTSPHMGDMYIDENLFRSYIQANPDIVKIEGMKQKVSVVIPSTGRPKQLRESVQRLFATTHGHNIEVICVIEHDKESVKAVQDLPVTVISRDEHKGPVYGWNEGAEAATGEYLVLGSDDIWYSERWLEAALVAMSEIGDGFVGLNDGRGEGDFCPHYMVSRKYINEYWGGVLCTPHYKHYFIDLEAAARAKADGKYIFAENALLEHRHHIWGKAEKDKTYQLGDEFYNRDKELFKARQEAGFPNDYEAVLVR